MRTALVALTGILLTGCATVGGPGSHSTGITLPAGEQAAVCRAIHDTAVGKYSLAQDQWLIAQNIGDTDPSQFVVTLDYLTLNGDEVSLTIDTTTYAGGTPPTASPVDLATYTHDLAALPSSVKHC